MNIVEVALTVLSSTVIGSLLVIFLTPNLQHYFWKYQRKEELRLTVIIDINRLTSEFITKSSNLPPGQYIPDVGFFQSLRFTTAQIKALFSEDSFQEFKKLEEMIGPNLNGKQINDFIEASDAALRSLYKEIRLPGL